MAHTPGLAVGKARWLRGAFWATHPFPSFLVAGATLAIALLVGGSSELDIALLLGAGMLCYQFAIGLTNDAADAVRDADAARPKPIARGDISRTAVTRLAIVFSLAGMAITWPLEHGAWYVGVLGLVCGLAYDLWLKRTSWSWVPLAVAVPLVPAWVFLAMDEWDALLWVGFPLGALLGLSLHLANQAPDIAIESVADGGIAHRLGEGRSRSLAVALFGGAGSVMALALLLSDEPWGAALASVVTVAVGFAGFRGSSRFGRSGLFGVLAVGSAALGAVFVWSI